MRPLVIGQDTLERVRRDTDIVALIGESVKLQKRGRSYVGLCPFHSERTPSFHVNKERGFYHCFGCHESGDAIKFVQNVEGLDFIEAVRRLCERAGIELVENISHGERQQQLEARRRSDELYALLNTAAAWYERMLREHPLAGYARAELERRALVAATPTDAVADALQAFRIGYAPYGWDGLARHLRERGESVSAAERAGLLAPRKSGSGHYDRFRHRLMFAVIDGQGRVIAFSGRALPEPSAAELAVHGLEGPGANAEAPAKYVNSPESAVYRKREALFGLYQARQGIRAADRAVLVEGNFDVVSLHARGVKNVVAPLGTAFTPEQARQIRRYCQEVTLLFDPDEAGRRAVRAARDVCRDAGLWARVSTLPAGKDPDDLARGEGREGLERVLAAAQPLLEYLLDSLLDESFAASDARARAARVNEAIELLAAEKDPTVRAMAESHADRIAERLGIADARTFRALSSAVRRGLQPEAPGQRSEGRPERARSRDRRQDIHREILGAFFDFPELFEDPQALLAADFLEGEEAAAFAATRQSYSSGQLDNPEVVLAKLAPAIHPFARARLAAPRHARPEDARTELAGNMRQLKSLVLTRDKKTAVEELERAKKSGDVEQEDMLLGELFRKAKQKALASD